MGRNELDGLTNYDGKGKLFRIWGPKEKKNANIGKT